MDNILILGSGRSGTSMLAGALYNNSSYFMGENPRYLGENKANPRGFFEDYEVNTINEDILKLTFPIFPEFFRKIFFPTNPHYRHRWLLKLPVWFPITGNETISKRIQTLIENQPFCFKDPRFSYTLPVWQKYIPEETKFLVIYRHPTKTIESILRECRESRIIDKIKINEKEAYKIWNSMYSHILKNYEKSHNTSKWLFIHYDQVITEKGILKIEKFLGSKIDRDFIQPELSRARNSKEISEGKTKKLYTALNKLSAF